MIAEIRRRIKWKPGNHDAGTSHLSELPTNLGFAVACYDFGSRQTANVL